MNIAPYIENTLLRPDAGESDYLKLFAESEAAGFHAVCIPPARLSLAREHLSSDKISLCTVIGFPCGYTSESCKMGEAREAVQNGADELDMVMSLGLFKDGQDDKVVEEIRGVKMASKLPLKVIIEAPLLSGEEIFRAARLCMEGGADFVKTCTGFNGGASLESIGIIKEAVKGQLEIKASGGISSYSDALSFIDSGVSRIGTSKGHRIWQEALEA